MATFSSAPTRISGASGRRNNRDSWTWEQIAVAAALCRRVVCSRAPRRSRAATAAVADWRNNRDSIRVPLLRELKARMQKKPFTELGLSPELLKAVAKMG